jgi:CSLREA domain-containing protein
MRSLIRSVGAAHKPRVAPLFLAGLASLIGASLVHAATIPVDTLADDAINGNCSLREAILAANANFAVDACPAGEAGPAVIDVILLSAGTYLLAIPGSGEEGGLTGDLDITDDVVLRADSADATVIDADALDRVIHVIGADVTLESLTLRGGDGGDAGGGIQNGGPKTSTAGTVTLLDSIVTGNRASAPIGVHDGGGIANYGGSMFLAGSVVSDNTATDAGGGILNNAGTVILTDSTVSGNTARDDGGGIRNTNGLLTLTGSTVSGNTTGDDGGGIRNDNGFVLVTKSEISGNTADDDGGPISNFGGGIYNNTGTTELVETVVSGNVAALDGGGIANENGTVVLTDCTVSGNVADDDGGGIRNDDTMVLENTTVSGNVARLDAGGGLFNVAGTLSLVNSTVSGNLSGGKGGGIFNRFAGSADLSSSTVSANTAGDAGTGIRNDGTMSFQNTIIAGNGANSASDCSDTDTLSSLGHNLVGDGTGCPSAGTGDQTVDPTLVFTTVLAPLADNAGPTETHALLLGSAALDAGDAAGCTDAWGAPLKRDQRGLPRTQDGLDDGTAVCDVGAYERQPTEAVRMLVLALEVDDLEGTNGETREAMLAFLAKADRSLADGKGRKAGKTLRKLRSHVDGCGATSDGNDWVLDCDAQIEIRDAIDALL